MSWAFPWEKAIFCNTPQIFGNSLKSQLLATKIKLKIRVKIKPKMNESENTGEEDQCQVKTWLRCEVKVDENLNHHIYNVYYTWGCLCNRVNKESLVRKAKCLLGLVFNHQKIYGKMLLFGFNPAASLLIKVRIQVQMILWWEGIYCNEKI